MSASVATVQRALGGVLGSGDTQPEQWLGEALRQSTGVFTCSGVVDIGEEEEEAHEEKDKGGEGDSEEEGEEPSSPSSDSESDRKRMRVEGVAKGSMPVCRYGVQCYRKNPEHFKQFSHPHLLQPTASLPTPLIPAASASAPSPAAAAGEKVEEAHPEPNAAERADGAGEGKEDVGEEDDDWEVLPSIEPGLPQAAMPNASANVAPPPHQPTPFPARPTSDRSVRLSFTIPPSAEAAAAVEDPLLPVRSSYQMTLPFPPLTTSSDVDRVMASILPLCRPATFGVGGEAVLDPSYRQCSQLPPSEFFTSFSPDGVHPSILRDVIKLLCPTALPSLPSLRAQLYKMNVYTKGGLFKAHRDTPRSDEMIASLVVCLPLPHEGGALIVRHGGKEVTYDWSWSLVGDSRRRQQIQWAAFFGDCEHEIKEVSAGYRVTLTYNLFVSSASTRHPITPASPPDLRFTSTPFPALLRLLLTSPTFMPQGGRMGVFCSHGYAHTSASMQSTLNPSVLKGGDALLFEAATQLGLSCSFVPVLGGNGWGDGTYVFDDFLQTDTSCTMAGDDDDDDDMDEDKEVMGQKPSKDILWLNEGGVKELQEAHAAYGNEPTMGTMYSRCALIIAVGRWEGGKRLSAKKEKREEVLSSLLHPHVLVWSTRPYPQGHWRCDVCGRGGRGGVYHCGLCGWDACTQCKERVVTLG